MSGECKCCPSKSSPWETPLGKRRAIPFNLWTPVRVWLGSWPRWALFHEQGARNRKKKKTQTWIFNFIHNIKFTISTSFKVSGIKHIHIAGPPSPQNSSSYKTRTFPIEQRLSIYSLSQWVWFLQEPRISGILQCLSCCACFISFSMKSSRLTHAVTCVNMSFLFKAE